MFGQWHAVVKCSAVEIRGRDDDGDGDGGGDGGGGSGGDVVGKF